MSLRPDPYTGVTLVVAPSLTHVLALQQLLSKRLPTSKPVPVSQVTATSELSGKVVWAEYNPTTQRDRVPEWSELGGPHFTQSSLFLTKHIFMISPALEVMAIRDQLGYSWMPGRPMHPEDPLREYPEQYRLMVEQSKPVFPGAKLFQLKATHGLPLGDALRKVFAEGFRVDWVGFIDEARLNRWWDFAILQEIQDALEDAEADTEYVQSVLYLTKLSMQNRALADTFVSRRMLELGLPTKLYPRLDPECESNQLRREFPELWQADGSLNVFAFCNRARRGGGDAV